MRFFSELDHKIVPSCSLVPPDSTLLFTNAGMNQFKPYFTGAARPEFSRAASVQKCMRAGGKHNDLENVGFTKRHHTFFEMLGNFSFGDYFKREAISWAWQLLTEVFGIDPHHLVVSVFKDDQEAFDIWRDEIGLPEEKIFKLGKKDNFWEMGDVGPVGYSSEIHYDHGPDADPKQKDPGQEGERFLELWNLVFMEFYKDENGHISPLPRKNIDTGAGLERIAAVLQGVDSNYDTDLFTPIIERITELTGQKPNASHRVMADHARALVFAISDGIYPSNYGRGYVLRRVLRRAHSFAQKLGVSEPVLYKLVDTVVDVMVPAYPELAEKSREIADVIKAEEQRFLTSIERSLPKLLQLIEESRGRGSLPGQKVFQLYDTYGLPLDLVEDYAASQGLEIDWPGFKNSMEEQRAKARSSGAFKLQLPSWSYHEKGQQEFTGYDKLEAETDVMAFGSDDKHQYMVLRENPFYPESGGQLSDKGVVKGHDYSFFVQDVRKIGDQSVLIGRIKGEFSPGPVRAEVEKNRRAALARAHTATHLLHAALRELVGDWAVQRGSLVDEDRLRFDFSNSGPLDTETIENIEKLVNQKVLDNIQLTIRYMDYERAKQEGVMALFEAKYGQRVRVVEVPGFSKELCGGTHVQRTGDIGLFSIVSEEAVSAGVRRVEAVVGLQSLNLIQSTRQTLKEVARQLGAQESKILQRVSSLMKELSNAQSSLARMSDKLASVSARSIEVQQTKGVQWAVTKLQGFDQPTLRKTADALAAKGVDVIFLISHQGEKCNMHARSRTQAIDARQLINIAGKHVKGGGGGKPDKAEGGGSDVSGIESALVAVREHVTEKLGGARHG